METNVHKPSAQSKPTRKGIVDGGRIGQLELKTAGLDSVLAMDIRPLDFTALLRETA